MTNDKRTWQERCEKITLEKFGLDCVSMTDDLYDEAIGFREGFDAGRKDALKEAQVLVEALNAMDCFTNKLSSGGYVLDSTHSWRCPKCKALAAWREKTGE